MLCWRAANVGLQWRRRLQKNTDARIVALADIFPDQLAKARTHFDEVNMGLGHPAIDPKLMFRGYTAFQQLTASPDVDAIQISTPPFFHVEHLDGVVSAGNTPIVRSRSAWILHRLSAHSRLRSESMER
jgi:myo-inositol 2-dehydrogenase/D-chiro-inositol 1-dehydrogenase